MSNAENNDMWISSNYTSILSNYTANQTSLICPRMNLSRKVKDVLISSYVFIFIMGIAGNIAVIYVIGIKNQLVKCFDFQILSLAVADMLSAIFVPIVAIQDLMLNLNAWVLLAAFGCKIFVAIDHVAMLVSSFMLILISVERLR